MRYVVRGGVPVMQHLRSEAMAYNFDAASWTIKCPGTLEKITLTDALVLVALVNICPMFMQ